MWDNEVTAGLVEELRTGPTDLAKLVERVARKRKVLAIPVHTITAWEERAPQVWARVHQWLGPHGIVVVTA